MYAYLEREREGMNSGFLWSFVSIYRYVNYIYREREGGNEFWVSLEFCRGLCNLRYGKLKPRAVCGLLLWHAPTSQL